MSLRAVFAGCARDCVVHLRAVLFVRRWLFNRYIRGVRFPASHYRALLF